MNRSGYRVYHGVCSAMYDKILKISNASRTTVNAGRLQNIFAMDVKMIFGFFVGFGAMMISAPFFLIGILTLIFLEVGWIGIVAPGVIFVIGIFSGIFAFFSKKIRTK